jgi:hypothetical protein
MLDYQRIVDDVRSLLGSNGGEGMDFLRAAAADYSVACDEVNERLRQCGTRLRQGLRSEAIQLCEMEPNLLDVVAVLDFPERTQWMELAERSGMASSTPLMLDVAADLNEAYAVEQPMSSVLRIHRLLALGHGPLTLRIKVLRRLADMDPDNPVWQEDLRIFEMERQKQIQTEVEVAARVGDTESLMVLDVELSNPDWKNPPPPSLAKSAGEALARLQYWAMQSQLERLATELSAAMTQFQPELGRTLRDRWNEIVASSHWELPPQVVDRAAPALHWLDEQDETLQEQQAYEAAVAALTKNVASGRSLAQLERLYTEATDCGDLPDDLEERCLARLAVLRRSAWIRKGLLATAVVVVIVVAAWGLKTLVANANYERDIVVATANVPILLEHGHFEQAESQIKNLSPKAQKDQRIHELLVLVQKKQKEEKTRQTTFSQKLVGAKQRLDQTLKMLDNEQSQATLDHLWRELELPQGELKEADALSQTDEERTSVVDAQKFAAQVQGRWQNRLDEAFVRQYEDFSKQLTQIERDKIANASSQRANLNSFTGNLKAWENISGHVSSALQARITTLQERATALESAVQRQESEENDVRQITAAVGEATNYRKALQEYVRHNPDSERTPDVKRAAEESLCWQSVAEWNQLAVPWRQTGLKGLRPAAAEEQVKLAINMADTFSECKESDGVRHLLPYLKAVANRDNGGERIEASLKKLFADRLVADAWMIEISKEDNGNETLRYYAAERPTVTVDSEVGTNFRYICNFDGKARSQLIKKGDRVKQVGRSPQTAVAEHVQPILNSLADANWEESFCKIIAILQADHAMDPVLKANLLQQTLEIGVRGSCCLDLAFRKHLEWFSENKINAFANWLDPDDKPAVKERENAAKLLETFPDVNAAIKTAMYDWKTPPRPAEFRWVGWLHQTRDGHWKCLMPRTPNAAGPLIVVCRRSAGGKPQLATIGQFERGTVKIDSSAGPQDSLLVEGRPIYLSVQ